MDVTSEETEYPTWNNASLDNMDSRYSNASDFWHDNMSQWQGNESDEIEVDNAELEKMWEGYNLLCTYVVPRLFALIISLSLAGNIAVIGVIVGQPKMRKPLNIFLLNLAVSDVTLASIGLPFVAYRYAADTWALSDVICALHNYVINVTVYVSIYTMAAVAAYRCYITIKTQPSRGVDIRPSVVCIVVIWVVFLIANLPVLYLYDVKTYRDSYRYCAVEHGREHFLSFFIFAYALPLCIAASCTVVIISHLRRHEKNATASSPQSKVQARHARLRNWRATRLLIAVLVAFTLCWLPLHVFLLLSFSGFKTQGFVTYEIFRVLTFCLAYSSTIVNPIIYNFASPDFRSGFKRIFYKLICCSSRFKHPTRLAVRSRSTFSN